LPASNSPLKSRIQLEQFLQNSIEGACFLFHPQSGKNKNNTGLLFTSPQAELVCNQFKEVPHFFKKTEAALAQGYFLAGYFTYEFGYIFESIGTPPSPPRQPLAWFGIFESPQALSSKTIGAIMAGTQRKTVWPDYWLHPCIPELSYTDYCKNIAKIQRYITAGDTYQVNYTFLLKTRVRGNHASLFIDLYQKQPVGYPALVRGGGRTILSLSPELFFARDGRKIIARPMKGTAARTGNQAEDRNIRKKLAQSPKNRAENVMIVDLLRNDLSRLCETGSVQVKKLFQVETYRTVFQMTSTIQGYLLPQQNWHAVFRNIFPCGSVTGAPKIRTMQIIAELEKHSRGIYTGALGYITPRQKAIFNVPIRTLEIDQNSEDVFIGIGSGVVADSNSCSEWKESHAKAQFIQSLTRDYHLIETLRWDPASGYHNLPLHLQRLQKSAQFFGIPYNNRALAKELQTCSDKLLENTFPRRVRILLDYRGCFKLEFHPLTESLVPGIPRVKISRFQVDSHNIFLYHKTSNRELYNQELERARRQGLVDILFTNEYGAVTEGTITNVYIKKNGIWWTPPISAGLLPGIARQKLLQQRRLKIKEKTIYPSELETADEIRLSNSVRGWFEVKLVR